jgi:hypothetical protein
MQVEKGMNRCYMLALKWHWWMLLCEYYWEQVADGQMVLCLLLWELVMFESQALLQTPHSVVCVSSSLGVGALVHNTKHFYTWSSVVMCTSILSNSFSFVCTVQQPHGYCVRTVNIFAAWNYYLLSCRTRCIASLESAVTHLYGMNMNEQSLAYCLCSPCGNNKYGKSCALLGATGAPFPNLGTCGSVQGYAINKAACKTFVGFIACTSTTGCQCGKENNWLQGKYNSTNNQDR